jgi:plasmid maintenance system antidote protein VapI
MMQTTIQLLDAVKAKYGIDSDYALAKQLMITRQTISHLRAGDRFIGEDVALQVAQALDVSPAYVLSCAAAERATGDKKKVWERVAKRLATAVIALLAAVPLGAPTTAEAARNQGAARGEVEARCIMLNNA